eukprot:1210508-Rhodomonas_salina.1
MSGTVLRPSCAKSGTHVACARSLCRPRTLQRAKSRRKHKGQPQQRPSLKLAQVISATFLRPSCALSGTELGTYAVYGTDLAASDAVCGTELGYGTTSTLRGVWY